MSAAVTLPPTATAYEISKLIGALQQAARTGLIDPWPLAQRVRQDLDFLVPRLPMLTPYGHARPDGPLVAPFLSHAEQVLAFFHVQGQWWDSSCGASPAHAVKTVVITLRVDGFTAPGEALPSPYLHLCRRIPASSPSPDNGHFHLRLPVACGPQGWPDGRSATAASPGER